jgi:putative inorganic carbon (HCO3(-)) transporter
MNNLKQGLNKIYPIGMFIILALPLLVLPPYFSPADWGKSIVFRSIMAMLLFTFLFQLFYKKRDFNLLDVAKNKTVWVLALFFLITLLATIFSQDVNFSLWGSPYRAQGAINLFFYMLFTILSFLILKKPDWNRVWNFSFVVGVLVSFIAIIQYYGLFSKVFVSAIGRPQSTMGNPILLAIYLLLLIFIALAFAIKENNKTKKILYCAIAFLFSFTLLLTGSRATYLGLFFGIAYFLLLYPIKKDWKKISVYKIIFAIILILGLLIIYYVNTRETFPTFLENNKIFHEIKPRLQVKMFLDEPRFSAWQVAVSAIKEKPLLGWGPENLAIGFDKYYDPSLPFISKAWGGWWDRAHNIVLDVAATSGVPATIIYLSLFIILFWKLQKSKKEQQVNRTREDPIIYHGIQATIIAYFITNFFSFDGFSTYLLFFLIIGYCLHLTTPENSTVQNTNNQEKIWGAGLVKGILFIFLIIFLWIYNLVPLQINSEIVRAENLAENKKCERAFSVIDKVLAKHSFLDAYLAIHYVELARECAGTDPARNLKYAEKSIAMMKEAVKTRPLYSRLWLFLGSFTTVKANSEEDATIKKQLIDESYTYFEKARQLAPKHQEVLIEWAKTNMVEGDYQTMKEKSIECISLDQSLSDCYSIKAAAEVYLNNLPQAKKDFEVIFQRYSDAPSESSLYLLVEAYDKIENYAGLIDVYKKLVRTNPKVAQYHSSLAFAYYKVGDYKNAREEAMIFLELMPEAKDETEMFLKMLPN